MTDASLLRDKTTLHLLPPTLDISPSALPPVLEAHARPVAAKDPRKVFYKMAMKESGRIPGRGMVDGRRKLIAVTGQDLGAR